MLVTEKMNDTARERIRTLVESTDGFYISEMDLKLRGPGEFFGTKQSGLPSLRVANILRDTEILEVARREAVDFIARPPSEEDAAAGGGVHSRSLAAPLRPGDGGLMRVIAGEFRSRRSEEHSGHATRPTPDRLRETLFDILGPRIEGATFLDAYAGTGAVGIEALSRGARARVVSGAQSRRGGGDPREFGVAGIGAAVHGGEGSGAVDPAEGTGGDRVPGSSVRAGTGIQGGVGMLSQAPPELTVVQHSVRLSLPETVGALRRTRVVKQGDNALSFFAAATPEATRAG